jgi:hypothetical protein
MISSVPQRQIILTGLTGKKEDYSISSNFEPGIPHMPQRSGTSPSSILPQTGQIYTRVAGRSLPDFTAASAFA